MAARLAEALPPAASRVLTLGFEELMYTPLRLARELEQVIDAEVRYSTTTRSPGRACRTKSTRLPSASGRRATKWPPCATGPTSTSNRRPTADAPRGLRKVTLTE